MCHTTTVNQLMSLMTPFLADRTNARAYATLQCCTRLSSVCDVCIVAKRCILDQKLLLIAYIGSRI